MEKKIIVKGGLGVSARRDRCVDRIIDRGGCFFSLPAHIKADKPMVIKKYRESGKHTPLKVNQESFTAGENQS